MLLYDYSRLDGLITKCFGTRYAFAKAMGMSERSLSLKMNNIRSWKQPEISLAIFLLGIQPSEIALYFFTKKVQVD